MTPNRLLLVAQSPVLRYGIQILVESTWALGAVAEAENTLEVYRLAARFAPDLAIVQDALPGVTGIISARLIRQLSPETRVIVLADKPDVASRAAGELHGVDALLPTAIEPDDLTEAVRGLERTRPGASKGDIPAIQIALLDGLSRGMSLGAIAAATGAAVESLNDGFASLLTRFEASDVTSLIVNAIRRGWIDPQAQLPGAGPTIGFAVAA